MVDARDGGCVLDVVYQAVERWRADQVDLRKVEFPEFFGEALESSLNLFLTAERCRPISRSSEKRARCGSSSIPVK